MQYRPTLLFHSCGTGQLRRMTQSASTTMHRQLNAARICLGPVYISTYHQTAFQMSSSTLYREGRGESHEQDMYDRPLLGSRRWMQRKTDKTTPLSYPATKTMLQTLMLRVCTWTPQLSIPSWNREVSCWACEHAGFECFG